MRRISYKRIGFRHLFLVLIICQSLSIGLAVSVQGASQKTKALTAYADMLAGMPKTFKFATALIDNNSIPELIVRDAKKIDTMYRWTGSSVAAVELDGNVSNSFLTSGYYQKKSVLVVSSGVNGKEVYEVYRRKRLVGYLEQKEFNRRMYDGTQWQPVSLKKFQTALSRLTGDAKAKPTALKWRSNSAAKRKKYLKTKGSAASLKLNMTALSLNTGAAKPLKAAVTGLSSKITWSTSDADVATVSSKGKVKGIQEGTAVITARANNLQVSCVVTVKEKELFPKVSTVRMETRRDLSGMESYALLGFDNNGKMVWESEYTTGLSYPSGQYPSFQYIEWKNYIYTYEQTGFFNKVERDTGEFLFQSGEYVLGPASLYVDEFGTLYATPFDGEDVLYILNDSLQPVKEVPYELNGQVMEKVIRGKIGPWVIIGSEGSDSATAVPVS